MIEQIVAIVLKLVPIDELSFTDKVVALVLAVALIFGIIFLIITIYKGVSKQ